MKKIIKLFNDNHWYLIGLILTCILCAWLYGCQSEVASMIDKDKRVTRDGLQLEADYLIGQLKVKMSELDRQDELKLLLLEQASIFSSTGTFNPAGLMNTVISIAAISFGLNRNQKLKQERKGNGDKITKPT